jgi:hypothetical protein
VLLRSMPAIEVKTALRHLPELARHPRWLSTLVRTGRPGLFRQVVDDSLNELQGAAGPSSLSALAQFEPVSTLGRMGGTQEFLFHLVRLVKPTTVVETGVYRGISSAFLLSALEANGQGRLFSIDLPRARYSVPGRTPDHSPLPHGEETGFAIPERLKYRWTLVVGDSRRELEPLLRSLAPVDLFIHDSEHSYDFMKWEYAAALPHLRDGGILASDDIDWNSAFSELVGSGNVGWAVTIQGKLGIAVVARRAPALPNGNSVTEAESKSAPNVGNGLPTPRQSDTATIISPSVPSGAN